ncbi:MAG: hypothetical protein RLO81_03805 [Fulvivirga sp.]|uniref:toxin-antitoxin system YwqK family antitoxin n=1 Tax=Fulvivirga sp. TaxID=1931237 RepID=UPI0032EBE8EE
MYKYLIFLFILFSCSDNIERTYYPSGELWTMGERINGKREGDWIQFEVNGDTAFVTPYVNGLRHGVERQYDNNNVMSTWSYRLDTGHGLYQNFYPDGSLLNQGYKEKGYHVGEWTNYYNSGEIQSVALMKDEMPISETGYYRNGQVQFKIDDRTNGTYTFYDSLGGKLFEATMKDGRLIDTLFHHPNMPNLLTEE